MKIISWNVNGIRACAKKGLLEFLQKEKPDFFCVQETKAIKEQAEKEVQTLDYKSHFWVSAQKKGYSGVATFTNEVCENMRGWGQEKYDNEGRIIITKTKHFHLYNIYFPNGGSGIERHQFKQQFLHDLNDHLKAQIAAGIEIILVGDYNVAHREVDLYDPVRLSKESGFLPEERQWFDRFIELGFVDTFRFFHPDQKQAYSWWSYRELARISNRGWRIDYVCVTKGLQSKLKSAAIMADVMGSDHCPVMVELSL